MAAAQLCQRAQQFAARPPQNENLLIQLANQLEAYPETPAIQQALINIALAYERIGNGYVPPAEEPVEEQLIGGDHEVYRPDENDLNPELQAALLMQQQQPAPPPPLQLQQQPILPQRPLIAAAANVEPALLTRILQVVANAFMTMIFYVFHCFSRLFQEMAPVPGGPAPVQVAAPLPEQVLANENEQQAPIAPVPGGPVPAPVAAPLPEQVHANENEQQAPIAPVPGGPVPAPVAAPLPEQVHANQNEQQAQVVRNPEHFAQNLLVRVWDHVSQIQANQEPVGFEDLINAASQADEGGVPRIQEIEIPALNNENQNYLTPINRLNFHALVNRQHMNGASLRKGDEVHLIFIDARARNTSRFYYFGPNHEVMHTNAVNDFVQYLNEQVPIAIEQPFVLQAMMVAPE